MRLSENHRGQSADHTFQNFSPIYHCPGKEAELKYRAAHFLMLCLVLLTAGGANCRHMARQVTEPAPIVLPPQPTLAQVIDVVNTNRSRITTFSSSQAKLKVDGLPAIQAKLSVGGQRRVRLQAESAITGQELDLGSNDELFWVWVKRNQPAGVYYARHDQFANSPARAMMPIEPKWLVEALGLVYFDPQIAHQGPFRRPDGNLDIRTPMPSSQGQVTKVTTIDSRTGWVLNQQLLDSQSRVIASAISSRHARDPISGVNLPRKTVVSWPGAGMKFTLELHDLEINPLELNPALWTRPEYPGFPNRDITQLQPNFGQAG